MKYLNYPGQEVPFPADQNGRPEGNGCVAHVVLAVKLCPSMTFDAVVEKLNKDTKFKETFFAAEKLLMTLDENRTIPQITPPTSVETTTANRSSFEFGNLL